MMKKNGREKHKKGKEGKEGHGKNNRIEIVPYSLLFFHDFSPPSHHFPSFSSSPYPFLLPPLLLSHHFSSFALFVTISTHTLIVSLPHPLSSPLLTSPPSPSPLFFITLFFLSTLFYHPLLPLHLLTSPPPLSPPYFIPFSFLPTLLQSENCLVAAWLYQVCY